MLDEKQILKRTFSLYSRYGIKSVCVDDVAMMLGMSKKTIYEHFKNRETLIEMAVSDNIDSFLADLDKRINPKDDVFIQLSTFFVYVIQSVKKINPAFIYDLKKYSNDQYKLMLDLRDDKLFQIFNSIMDKGIEDKIFRGDIERRYVYYNQIEKTSSLVNDFHFESPPLQINPQMIYRLILNDICGLTTLRGHEIFEAKYELLVSMF